MLPWLLHPKNFRVSHFYLTNFKIHYFCHLRPFEVTIFSKSNLRGPQVTNTDFQWNNLPHHQPPMRATTCLPGPRPLDHLVRVPGMLPSRSLRLKGPFVPLQGRSVHSCGTSSQEILEFRRISLPSPSASIPSAIFEISEIQNNKTPKHRPSHHIIIT